LQRLGGGHRLQEVRVHAQQAGRQLRAFAGCVVDCRLIHGNGRSRGYRGGGTIADFNFASTGGQSWQINGARTWDTLVTFDGAPAVRTRANGAVIGVADVDSTQEIQVMTANYAAEYGRAAGGQIRIVTKSGTSDFHGSLYEYFRNSAMNANTWSRNLSTATNFASPFRYNNFGGTVGGPVSRRGTSAFSRASISPSGPAYSCVRRRTISSIAPTSAVPT